MTTCPKCGYVRKPSDTAPDWQCPSCGIAYAKFRGAPRAEAAAATGAAPAGAVLATVRGRDAWDEGQAAFAAGNARLIVASKEGLRWYALGAIVWMGFVVASLWGLARFPGRRRSRRCSCSGCAS